MLIISTRGHPSLTQSLLIYNHAIGQILSFRVKPLYKETNQMEEGGLGIDYEENSNVIIWWFKN